MYSEVAGDVSTEAGPHALLKRVDKRNDPDPYHFVSRLAS